jgi:hypothetical protein
MSSYSCAGCQRQVSEDEAFLRSVNLRMVAWCSPCWRDRHADQLMPVDRLIPAQRQSSRDVPEATPLRRALRREPAG